MKKTMILLLLLLPAIAMAQVVEVNVSALSEEDSNERMGVVVLQEDADNESFYNLMKELKSHSDKVGATKNQADRKKNEAETGTMSDVLNDAIAQLDDLKKKGLISEADYQKMKAQMSAQVSADMKKDAAAQEILAEMAAQSGSSNPSALKEQLRSYCIDKRFFYQVSNEVDGMVRVETRTADGKRRLGFIDLAKAKVVIDPDRYDNFNMGVLDKQFRFTKDGYIIGHLRDASEMIDKSGRVLLSGYRTLIFYNDCRILRAQNYEEKWGIIDYQGNVLEPFIHSSSKSEELQKAANRIFNEKGGVKVEIW